MGPTNGSEGNPSNEVGVIGLVLVGGASSRMGQDKATLDFNGRQLASVAVQALHGAGVETVATVGHFDIDGAHRCNDLFPGAGPLGGIVSGIEWAIDYSNANQLRLRSVVILACDLPFVDVAALTALLDASNAADAGTDGVLGCDAERSQPLFSLMQRSAFGPIRSAFNNGARSPMQVFASLALSVAPAIRDGRLADVDTPDQLAAAQLTTAGFPENPPISG